MGLYCLWRSRGFWAGWLAGWLAFRPRQLRVSGGAYSLPGLGLALILKAVAVVDIAGAATTLYVLLPDDAAPNSTLFFAVFVEAITLGIPSHSPGGLGVFEALIIAGLEAGGRSDVLAALLLYRIVYTRSRLLWASR